MLSDCKFFSFGQRNRFSRWHDLVRDSSFAHSGRFQNLYFRPNDVSNPCGQDFGGKGSKGFMVLCVTGRIILPIRKHNFATELPACPLFATQASGAAVA